MTESTTRIGRVLLAVAMLALLSEARHDPAAKSRVSDVQSLTSSKITPVSGSEATSSAAVERRVRKRSKWLQSRASVAGGGVAASHGVYFSKDGSFLKRIVTEVIAERDAQIAAALFEVAKNQPHLQMMVQTLAELSSSNQRLELSSTRLDETQRRLDSRLGVISEKMTLLENRLGQTERRIEREMTQVHNKIDDIVKIVPDKTPDLLVRSVKQIQDQVNVIEEILLERGSGSNQIPRTKSRSKSGSAEMHKLANSLSQAIAAVHNDLVRLIREAENSLDHQLSMLASDNGVFSCAISRLLDNLSTLLAHRPDQHHKQHQELSADANANLSGNSIDTFDQLASNATRCLLKCP